ncbi:Integrase catalytic domain-containing protein, partial [Aphis craccivora]
MLHISIKDWAISNTDKGEQTATTSTTTHVANETDNVLLGTAVVEVFGLNGERAYARALLDSGSTNHFICLELQYKPDSNGPVYRESKFGYIISGFIINIKRHKHKKHDFLLCISHENIHENKYESLENVIQQFWRIKDYGQSKPYTMEEQNCEQHFKENVSRSESGRFLVHLPFCGNVSKLGKSYDIAKIRLFAIERRFIKNPSLKGDYVKFMTEYEKLNHMTQNMDNGEIELPGRMCYLAHHYVQNENSLTTKLRVVFDDSTKTGSGVSLNDVLQKGPSIQEELIHILARFRTHNFVVTADIKKMYRQTCEKHRQYPTVAPLIAWDFYMDDFISGAATKKDAIEIRNALIKLMSTAKLELGKWVSNIIRDSFDNNDGLVDFQETSNELTRILGLYCDTVRNGRQYKVQAPQRPVAKGRVRIRRPPPGCATDLRGRSTINLRQVHVNWDSHTFELKYKINETSVVTLLTKCNILSDIARIYDPLGLIGLVIVCAKLIMQELWKEGLSWSEPVSEKISIEHITGPIPALHGVGSRQLLTQVLHRLMNTLQDNIPISAIQAWTDSSIVLSWLTTPHSSFKIFVTNRLAKIAELIPNCHWPHVASESNPADCVSRGLFPSQIPNHHLYWQGPQFLKFPESEWPTTCFQPIPAAHLPDFSDSTKACLVTLPEKEVEWFSRFSSLRRMQRVIIYRFIKHARKLPSPFVNDLISHEEVTNAMVPIIRITQSFHFVNLSNVLQTPAAKIVPRSLAQLAPFIDENEIIRVGGRLRHATLPTESKNPLLLPKSSALTTLIIRHCHLTYFHAGPQLISSLIAAHYWIMSSRSAIRGTPTFCCAMWNAIRHLQRLWDELQRCRSWKLGRIQQIHPGVDGVVRIATVRTEHGTLTRPIVKLAILPVD